jgi:hypothetical protein
VLIRRSYGVHAAVISHGFLDQQLRSIALGLGLKI